MSNKWDYRELLGEKNYLLRIIGQGVSRFGDSIDQLVFSWLMYQVTGNASMIALVLFFNYLPNILVQPFAGVLVDRFSKKKVLAICDIGRAAVVSLTLVLYGVQLLNVPLLILITLGVSTLESFKMPASTAVIPHLLPREKFNAGVALSSTVTRAAELIGRGAAGFFIAWLGIPGALGIDIGAFLTSAGLNLFLRFEEGLPEAPLTLRSYAAQFADGVRQLWKLKAVLPLLVGCSLINFMISPMDSYESAYVADSLKFGPQALSAIGVAVSLGIMLSSFLCPQFRRFLSGRKLLLPFGVLLALVNIGLWLLPAVPESGLRMALLIADQFCFGFSIGTPGVLLGAAMMSAIPAEYLARIQGVSGAAQCLMIPLGALLCSGLALVFPVPLVFLFFAVFILLAFGGGMLVKSFDQL